MLPPPSSPIWSEFVTGRRPLKSERLAINLMATNVRLQYQKDPSPASVKTEAARVYAFFVKYETAFAADFKALLS